MIHRLLAVAAFITALVVVQPAQAASLAEYGIALVENGTYSFDFAHTSRDGVQLYSHHDSASAEDIAATRGEELETIDGVLGKLQDYIAQMDANSDRIDVSEKEFGKIAAKWDKVAKAYRTTIKMQPAPGGTVVLKVGSETVSHVVEGDRITALIAAKPNGAGYLSVLAYQVEIIATSAGRLEASIGKVHALIAYKTGEKIGDSYAINLNYASGDVLLTDDFGFSRRKLGDGADAVITYVDGAFDTYAGFQQWSKDQKPAPKRKPAKKTSTLIYKHAIDTGSGSEPVFEHIDEVAIEDGAGSLFDQLGPDGFQQLQQEHDDLYGIAMEAFGLKESHEAGLSSICAVKGSSHDVLERAGVQLGIAETKKQALFLPGLGYDDALRERAYSAVVGRGVAQLGFGDTSRIVDGYYVIAHYALAQERRESLLGTGFERWGWSGSTWTGGSWSGSVYWVIEFRTDGLANVAALQVADSAGAAIAIPIFGVKRSNDAILEAIAKTAGQLPPAVKDAIGRWDVAGFGQAPPCNADDCKPRDKSRTYSELYSTY